jgi:hypothetical protein
MKTLLAILVTLLTIITIADPVAADYKEAFKNSMSGMELTDNYTIPMQLINGARTKYPRPTGFIIDACYIQPQNIPIAVEVMFLLATKEKFRELWSNRYINTIKAWKYVLENFKEEEGYGENERNNAVSTIREQMEIAKEYGTTAANFRKGILAGLNVYLKKVATNE